MFFLTLNCSPLVSKKNSWIVTLSHQIDINCTNVWCDPFCEFSLNHGCSLHSCTMSVQCRRKMCFVSPQLRLQEHVKLEHLTLEQPCISHRSDQFGLWKNHRTDCFASDNASGLAWFQLDVICVVSACIWCMTGIELWMRCDEKTCCQMPKETQ